MPAKKYIVELTTEERSQLNTLIHKDRIAAYRRRHAEMLLAVDQGPEGPALKDANVAAAFGCAAKTIERLRQRCVEEGLDAVLEHGNRGAHRVRRLDGRAEAHLIAVACGDPPAGRNRWSLRLLADQMVVLGHVDECSHMAVKRTLKKTGLSLT
jgi:transposase